MKTIRWGIIDGGDVCEDKSGPEFLNAMGFELVAGTNNVLLACMSLQENSVISL